jgi:uncharacterized membrane protein
MNFDKKISLILVVLLVIAVGFTVYIIVNPSPNEKFTELYILGAGDVAGNYPTTLNVGETGNVTIGIVNHEYSTKTYNLITILNNHTISNQNYTLSNNETKLINYSFTPIIAGNNQTLEFDLYKLPNNGTVYRSVFLHLNVV